MSQKDEKIDFTAEVRLQGIELLKGTLSLRPTMDVSIANFNFTINVGSKVDAQKINLFL